MAIYHLSVKTISRSNGQSAVAAAAYRSGARLRCDRTGRAFDYTRRHGVVATRIVVPQSETTIGREILWNRAEAAERRSNSTVAREFELALPHELDSTAREILALGFAKALADRYRIAVDVAIHQPSGRGDDRNGHAHLLTSTRVLEAEGIFGKKVRILDDLKTGPAEVVAIREMWAGMCNAALADSGVIGTVDHRSHAERDLREVPGRKLGVGATGYEARTGSPSCRRLDLEADALAETQALRSNNLAGSERNQAGHSDRRERFRAVLGHLRRHFTAATKVVVAGARSPAIERALASPGRLPDIVRSRSAPRRAAHVATAPSGPTLRQVGNGKRRHRDEAAEAAALYRWVDRELEAEHMAQVAQERAEAERAATRIAHADRPAPAANMDHREPILTPFGKSPRNRPGVVATGPVRPPPRHGRGADRSPPHSRGLDEGVQSRDEPMPAVAVVVTQDVDRQNLALMMARELERMHKRSRTRLARLAEAAGMDEEILEGATAAEGEEVFNLAALVAEPALAQLWDAWIREDGEKQAQSRRDRADDQPRPSVLDEAPEADVPRSLDVVVDGSAAVDNKAVDTPIATIGTLPYGRRDVVIDIAIFVIARGSWTPAIGDALAEELGTRRGWVWAEAQRVCRVRLGEGNPRALPTEKREEMRRQARQGATRWPGLLRNLDMILGGRIPPSRRR